MSNVLTIDVDGNNVTIDPALFKAWTSEAHGYLRKVEIENENFKLLVETVAETTKLPKAKASKYLKNHFKSANKELKAQADLFEIIDNAVGV